MGQYRVVLLIVINDEEPENEQPGENTANDFSGKMKVPESSRNCSQQKNRRRENVPPAFHRRIHRVRLGGEDEFFSGSHEAEDDPIGILPFVDNDFQFTKKLLPEAIQPDL